MNEIKFHERKIAKRVAASFVMDLVVARERQSMDFPSEEALKKYLKDHPSADPSKHSVKKSEGGKKPSGDSGAKSTLPPKSNCGSRVTTEITPADAFLPNSVDCGPFRTSIRCTFGRSDSAAAERERKTPSMKTPTDGSIPKLLSPLPKPRIMNVDADDV